MTTPGKAPRDRSFGGAPRLMPRATAASAARAARNASNRNLANGSPQRGSPRSMTPPKGKITTPPPQRKFTDTVKVRSLAPPQRIPRIETIHHQPKFCEEVKVADDPDILPQDNDSTPLPVDDGRVLIEALSSVTIEGKLDDHGYGCDATIAEISENEMESHFKQNQEDPTMALNTHDELKTASQTATPRTSRPPTPKSLESSRPQTPGLPSRPTTPAHPAQRNVTPSSRPTTPQRLPTSRPRTPNVVNTQQISRTPASPLRHNHQQSLNEPDDLKSTYLVKQKQFHQMKKELDLKQQAVLEVLDSIRTLRERMNQEGIGSAEGTHQQDFVVFNVGDWTAEEISHLCRDALEMTVNAERAGDLIGSLTPIDDHTIGELDEKVLAIPSHFADLCLQALTARQEIIDWVKELIITKQESTDHGDGEMIDRIAHYNAQGRELCDTLRELKHRADDIIDSMAQLSKRTVQERGILIAVGESLVREVARLRQDLENRSAVLDEIKENQIDIESSNEEIRRELEEERAARNGMKEKFATAEYQLRQARIRISKMDRQLRESEASITSLTSTVKSLEDQSRQKEVHLEARARKLKESLKTGEMTNNQLLQQRDSLQTEVENLKHQIENLTTVHKSAIKELTNQLNETKMALEEQKVISVKETDQREATEAALTESQNYIEELKAKITELENSRPNPDLPTEREMDLWAELQATKDTLHIAEEEVTACKREKVRFLESLTKITESESKVGMQQKLAAELLSKEEILGKMQIQIRELTKSIKLNEQKVMQYEQYVRDLQAHNRAVAARQESPESLDYQDLQQEMMSLRLNLLESAHRNEELSELLNKREQQLDQQDKTSRAQARVLKVREELINMLKNKETEQSRELCTLQQDLEHRMKIVDEVNKQIAAKADEIQELFVTLESKQQQIHRLEKIVLALEEQQRRAQAQRTRHEEKIAALEHELAAGGRRERKFLFF